MPPDDDFEIIETATGISHRDEVIVISDDEDVENRPPSAPGRRARPLSTDSSRSSSSSSAILDKLDTPRRHQHHVSKRRKAEVGDSVIPERIRRSPLTGHDDGYIRANRSFTPSGSRANVLFMTDDYIQSPPPKTLLSDRSGFVKGRIHDPFEKHTPPPPPPPPVNLCPYYYDPKLGVKMYRGPGYERFPVVFGTIKGHKAICDKWNADQNEQHEEDQLYIASLSGGVNPFTLTKTQTTAKLERQYLREVQDVFPQIQRKFVLERYRARVAANDALDNDIVPSAMEIISEIAELDTYPREEPPEPADESVILPEDGLGVTIVYDKNIPKNEAYRKEALRILADEFKHVPTIAINRALQEKQSLFDTFVYFNQSEVTYFDLPRDQKPYTRFKQPRIVLEKKYQRGFSEPTDSQLYVTLVNELQGAKQHEARELYQLRKSLDNEAAEAQNLLQHKLEGSLVECQTCFDDEIPMNRALMCEGNVGHFFCFGCVARLAESQIGAMKHEMMCMDSSGCKAILSVEGVGRAVPTKVVDKLAFYQQQAEISAAGIEGLEQCPHCEYKAICDPIEEDSVFMCQNPDCGKNSCRKCNEASHLPKSCEQAKKDKGLSARHLVEEARSEAMMRKCPKCRAKIIKELGCNKMVCSCGNMMCYVCQQDISGQSKDAGYQHFHKAGSKCPLYDAQGTERHDQDADAAEKEAIKKVKAQEGNEDLDDKELQIETGKTKAKKQSSKQVPAINPHPYAAFAGMPLFANLPPGLNPAFPVPPRAHDPVRRHRVAQDAQDQLQAQRNAILQQQIEQLRVQGEVLQREREALENRRLKNVHQAAQDAQQAAREAQERVNRMMGAAYGGYGAPDGHFGLFNANQVPGLAVQVGLPFMHDPYQHFPQPQQPHLRPMPQMPDLGPEPGDVDEVEMLLFGRRQQMNTNVSHQRNRNRNAARDELDNLDFAEYVLRAGMH